MGCGVAAYYAASRLVRVALVYDGRAATSAWPARMKLFIAITSIPARLAYLQAVVKRYVDGDMHALDKFPDGSQ